MARPKISTRFQLINDDFVKIGKGAFLAGAGAALTFVIEALPNINLGDWQPIVAAFLAVLVNIFRKYITENKY